MGYVVASVGAESGKVPYTTYIVAPDKLEKNRDIYVAFLRAVYKGQQWVDQHTAAEVAEAIAPQFADSDVSLLTTVVERYKSIGEWKTDPVMTEEDFTKLQDVIEDAGQLTARVDFAAVVDNSIASKVVGK
ncbi:hypothetical protein SDC9_134198 [bioreactor metagenome]|uniref:SsuA/THI5-like domain-containing protein n=1 Tax=bioreactor metagenome TaxID=1076179 RepID=A0A645DD28_9ZZZZ